MSQLVRLAFHHRPNRIMDPEATSTATPNAPPDDADDYQILGVTRDPSLTRDQIDPSLTHDQIVRAYHEMVRIWHPDRSEHPDADATTKRINGAYESLKKVYLKIFDKIKDVLCDSQAPEEGIKGTNWGTFYDKKFCANAWEQDKGGADLTGKRLKEIMKRAEEAGKCTVMEPSQGDITIRRFSGLLLTKTIGTVTELHSSPQGRGPGGRGERGGRIG